MNLNSRVSDDGQIAILELEGRFDAYEVATVKTWLEEAVNKTPAQIVVNLTKVNFIDSTGLATFVQGMKHCRNNDGDLVLYGLQQSVRVIFELTRLDRAFEIFETEDKALQAFGSLSVVS